MSDGDSWNDPLKEPAAAAPVQKKGMSGCMLAGLIVGGIGLFGMVLCCGGVGWFFYTFAPTISKEPEVVKGVGRKILNAEVLADFTPESAFVIDNMFVTMRIAEFKHKDGKGEIMMGNMKVKLDANQANDQTAQARGKFEQKIRDSLDIKKTEVQNVMINGQEVPVTIGEGTQRETGKEYHTVTTEFEHAGSATFLILQMADDIWDQAAVLKMLESSKPQE